MTSEPTGGACPDLQTLSAYLDGRLDAPGRARVGEHISRCDECYFVARETALMSAAALTPGRAARHYVPLLAAALILSIFAGVLWRQAAPAPTYPELVSPLVEAVGARRFFAPRLTGGFRYGPAVSVNRSSTTGPESEVWGVRAAALELIGRAVSSPAGRASRAAALLLNDEIDSAVRLYTELTQEQPAIGEWRSDLAAALLVRASRYPPEESARREQDLVAALRHAEQAVALAPELEEARFNLGLALKALGRAEDASRVFMAMGTGANEWSAAVREELRGMPTIR